MSDESWVDLPGDPFAGPEKLASVRIGDTVVEAGDRVRLAPRARADILDVALRGRIATITSIELDLEDTIHLAVVVDDDPGRDMGVLLQPGHRFFFGVADVEPLAHDKGGGTTREERAR